MVHIKKKSLKQKKKSESEVLKKLTRSSLCLGATGDQVVTQPFLWGFLNINVWRFVLSCILCSCGFILFLFLLSLQ